MKQQRPLGKDRALPVQENKQRHFQGVVAKPMPQANLGVSLDSVLSGLEEEGTALSKPQILPANSMEDTLESQEQGEGLLEAPCNLIDVSPYQPRLDLTEDELELLAQSIAAAGRVNRPIILRKKENGRYELIGGERRWRAVMQLGWPTIPARLVIVDDAEALVLAIADNEGQQGLSDFENGRAYQRALDSKAAPSIRALATRIGVSHPTVVRRLALTKLPQACLEFLERNPRTLGVKLASEFVAAGEHHPDLVLKALEKIDQEGLSQEQALKWLHAEIKGSADKGSGIQKSSHICRLPGGLQGEMVITTNAMKIKVPKGVNMDELQELVMAALNNS